MHDKKRDLMWQTCIITEVYFFVVGVAYILHARCVILKMSVIHLSLHESKAKVLGMPSPKIKNDFTLCCQILNS